MNPGEPMRLTLGFLGAGNMAEAIAKAAIDRGVLAPSQMIAADPSDARRDVFARLGIAVTKDNREVIGQSQQVMLAVKPQMMRQVAADLAACGSPQQIVQSIMAGISIAKLNGAITEAGGKPMRIVRIMPNTPMMIGYGMAGIATETGTVWHGQAAARGGLAVTNHKDDPHGQTAADRGRPVPHTSNPTPRDHIDELAMKLFSAGGKAIRVDESLIDAITAVSGSGPAYLFYLAEAMQQAATELGLGEHARLLVGQTLLGAAQLLMSSPDTAAELRRKVTSPGGTTEAAIRTMEEARVPKAIVAAIHAAERRGKELGK